MLGNCRFRVDVKLLFSGQKSLRIVSERLKMQEAAYKQVN